jgi:hypothetical protein
MSPKRDFPRYGCDAVIDKPIDLTDFVEKIQDALVEYRV